MYTSNRIATIVAAVLVAGSAGSGCASSGPYVYGENSTKNRSITLRIQNNYWQDVRVYLIRGGGTPIRIGYVNGMSTGVLRIRQVINGQAQILLRPLGTRVTFVTNAVIAGPGEELALMVHSSLQHSVLIRR